MVVQKYIVLLGERNGHQVWLAYDSCGRIGNASYSEAFRYDTELAAVRALRAARNVRNWPNAKVFGTLQDDQTSVQ